MGWLVAGLLLLALEIAIRPVAASDWLTVTGKALFTGTDNSQAKAKAITDAHQEAIYQVFGKDISVEDLFVNLRLSGSIVGMIPCGKVMASQIVKESVKTLAGKKDGSRLSEYRVDLKARVEPCPSEEPSGFWLDAGLNKTEFHEGDPVLLTLTASRDCYYYLFNILEDEKVLRLVPNRLGSDNRLKARQAVSFPNASDIEKGIRPLAHLPAKATRTTEALYVLALQRPVDFSGLGIQEGIFGVYDGRTAFIKAMIRVVTTIPIDQRAEQLIRFQIKAK